MFTVQIQGSFYFHIRSFQNSAGKEIMTIKNNDTLHLSKPT